ncbi:putative manganese-dependent inorganic diphosphatase [Salinispira pacifica]|uniref:inorganic diphosphatase n=1 Tax=Salinispira pacifica TaxID=1307761 RepID=V5WJ94_9SPIO|nr:putative manganese-dependent inorganic diphosphatase [Salinispira pacifica]AHC15705.1 Manganese-dependent inorganic pyrophosphatase [Salinispira pacifica]
MKTIYVSGHKNPDMDCTVASHAYAYLKNQIDPDNTYIPIRCGALNDQTKAAFKKADCPSPALYRELIPTVGDIARKDYISLPSNAPILDALELLYTRNISFIPVFNFDGFDGTVSINEVSAYLVRQSSTGRPVYSFSSENIPEVLPGQFIVRGTGATFDAPIMTGAMPFDIYLKRMKRLEQKPILVVGNRRKILEHAVNNQLPAIIITGVEDSAELDTDFSSFQGSVYLSGTDSAESIRLLRLSVPVHTIVNRNQPRVGKDESFEDVKRQLMSSEFRGLPVFDDEEFYGIVTRRRFIEKPVKDLILVDHNEIHQSVPGAKEANIVEIIDHHRFGAEKTNTPIYIASKPVGSSSTIVYQHFRMNFEDIPRHIAILLQSGIISDTVYLKSPTTTEEDVRALKELSILSGLDSETYATEMFSQLKALKERNPKDVVLGDFKTYHQFNKDVGIGQVEVMNLEEASEMISNFHEALKAVSRDKQLDWTMLLITDVMKEHSVLVSSGYTPAEKKLIYSSMDEHSFDLPHILSRKKQLLPEVLRVLEEISS